MEESSSDMFVKVLTLNAWGLPFGISKNVHERLEAICDRLIRSDYDVVFLEEIWKPSQYNYLINRLYMVYPHYHYFYGGVVGSGLCLFSRHPLSNIAFHQFQINGIPYYLTHFEWMAGKGIGVCNVHLPSGKKICVMMTHTHTAKRNYPYRNFGAQRMLQFTEIATFVNLLKDSCDGFILSGDFNAHSGEPHYGLITKLAGLKDAWLEVRGGKEDTKSGSSATRQDNIYHRTKKRLKVWEEERARTGSVKFTGNRIDFIFVNDQLEVKECLVRPWGPTISPDSDIPFSDHEPIYALLKFKPKQFCASNPNAPKLIDIGDTESYPQIAQIQGDGNSSNKPDLEQIKQLQLQAKEEYEKGLQHFKSYRKKFGIYSMLLVALYSVVLWFVPVPTIAMIPFSIGLGICSWHVVINEVYDSRMVQGALSAIRYWTWSSTSSTS